MFGDIYYCKCILEWSKYLNDLNKVFIFYFFDLWYDDKVVNFDDYNVMMYNMFMFEGIYEVILECKNYVFYMIVVYNICVIKGLCWWLYVNFIVLNVCEFLNCDFVILMMRNVLRLE